MCPLSRPTHIFGDLDLPPSSLHGVRLHLAGFLPPFFLFLLFSSLLPSFLSRNMFLDPDNDFVWILMIFLLIHMLPEMAGRQKRRGTLTGGGFATIPTLVEVPIGDRRKPSGFHPFRWWIQIVND